MGLGAAFGFICILATIYEWMPYTYIAFFIGLSQFIGTIGAMIAGGPLSNLAQTSVVTWQYIFYCLSAIGLILFILISLIIEKKRVNYSLFIVEKQNLDIKKNISTIMSNSQVWFIIIFCAFVYFSLEYLSENECKNLLRAKGFSTTFSAYMVTVSWLGFAIGSPIFGFISDTIKRRKPILLSSAVVTFLSLISIIYLPLSEPEALISFFFF